MFTQVISGESQEQAHVVGASVRQEGGRHFSNLLESPHEASAAAAPSLLSPELTPSSSKSSQLVQADVSQLEPTRLCAPNPTASCSADTMGRAEVAWSML